MAFTSGDLFVSGLQPQPEFTQCYLLTSFLYQLVSLLLSRLDIFVHVNAFFLSILQYCRVLWDIS